MRTNSEIRAVAREALGKSIFSSAWLGAIGAYLLTSLIVGLTSYLFIGFILMLPMIAGLTCYFLRLIRTGKTEIGEIFAGFRERRFWRSIGLYLLMSFYLFFWAFIPFALLIKPYSYRMAFYLMVEYPELSLNACITESRRMMNGYKWQAFCMDFSFIGWYILGYLACGIGALFVMPYQMTSNALFYAVLKKADSETEREADATLAEMQRNNKK